MNAATRRALLSVAVVVAVAAGLYLLTRPDPTPPPRGVRTAGVSTSPSFTAPSSPTSGPRYRSTTTRPWTTRQRTSRPAASRSSATRPPTTDRRSTAAVPHVGLRVVDKADLPDQAVDVLDRVRNGGPFRYDRDGVTFENRERRLPRHPNGWYREYTVTTPGSPDRGPRRLVVGRDGLVFYSDDHYESFVQVDEVIRQ